MNLGFLQLVKQNIIKQKFLSFLFCICGLLLTINAQAQVKAFVTQSSFYLGDPITLVIETDQSSAANPDLSPLMQDFEVKGSSTSSRTNFINGNRSFSKTWRIRLQAKKIGELLIPGINVGAEKTSEIRFTVNELPPEVAEETGKHIIVEALLDNDQKDIYVQQQVPYTVKFFYDAAMQTGEVILPTIENTNIRLLGKEKKYQTNREGRQFVVVERRYVVSPEKSGELIIPPTLVQGRIAITNGDSEQLRKRMDETDMLNELFFDLNSGSRFNPFDPFFSRRSIGPTRPYTVSSNEIKLDILPVPDEFTGAAWLPTSEIKMQDSWAKNPPKFKVGEPVSRTIVMQVKGLASSQIPEIEIPNPDGMKVYPEPSKGQSPNDGNTIYGLQQTDVSYIPNKSGEVTIPEIKIDWWDVNTKQQRTYILPKWQLNVTEGAVTSKVVSEELLENQSVIDNLEKDSLDKIEKNNSEISTSSIQEALLEKQSKMRVVALSLLLAALALVAWLIVKSYKKSEKYANNQNRKAYSQKRLVLKNSLLNACNNNDAKKSASLLLDYAAMLSGDKKITNLGALIKLVPQHKATIKELELINYAATEKPWNGSQLRQLVTEGLAFQSEEIKEINVGLAPLYPD